MYPFYLSTNKDCLFSYCSEEKTINPALNSMNKLFSFFVCFPLFLLYRGIAGATFTIQNRCDYTVWPGIVSNAGSPELGITGFELSSGGSSSFQVAPGWAGRLWARTRCVFDRNSNQGSCMTGDCGSGQVECNGATAIPPATLAEFSIGAGPGLQDYYDVSFVDGYNIPMIVEANGGSGPCLTTGCASDLNQQCPKELRVGDGDACMSACEAFGTPEYCCSGANDSPSTCSPSFYSQMFKSWCPHVYSYAYDDATSTFNCIDADYTITFCPSLTSQQKSSTDSQSSTEDGGAGSESGAGSGSHHHHKFYIGGGQFLTSSSQQSKILHYRSNLASQLITLVTASTTLQFFWL